MRPATMRFTTITRPPRDRTPGTYTCEWCGIEKPAGGHTTKYVCVDCKPLEEAFGGRK